jgi:glycosyltransferase involved in cell wall biosynthesis
MTGLSDIVWDMASELANQGHEVHIVASYHTNKIPDERVTLHNFKTPPLGYRNIVGQLWILKRATKVVQRISPDVVHAPEYVSTAVMASLRVESPIVLTVPGNIFHKLSIPGGSGYEWHFAKVLKWAARTSAKKCAAVIATSSEMKVWWERTGSPPARTPMIPLGVNIEKIRWVENGRQLLGLDSRKCLLYVGRFSIEKGVMDLIEAINLLPSEEKANLQFTLIGKGTLQRQMEATISQYHLQSSVRVMPWISQSELLKWYSGADFLVLPSRSEGLSRVLLEAMACGLPVVGSRVSGTSDHVVNNVTGYLFAPGNTQELAEILGKISQDRSFNQHMRNNTMNYVSEGLTWPYLISKIVDTVYIPVTEGRLPGAKTEGKRSD